MYGDFSYICRHVPSYPICNLFFRQLLINPHNINAPDFIALGLPDPSKNLNAFQTALKDAGVGVRPECSIPRMGAAGGVDGRVGNVPNILLCSLSFFFSLALAIRAGRRVAAVARLEIFILFLLYSLTCLFQLFDTGSFLKQGEKSIVWLTGIHQGLIVGLFWTLAWVGWLGFQVVEDGTLSSLVPYSFGFIILTVGSTYISLDVGFTITSYFQSSNPSSLTSAWLFSLLIVWPLVAIAFYCVVTGGVVVRVLKERKPVILLSATVFVFALSQGAYWGLSHKICTGSNGKMDGSWIATLLETVSMALLFLTWKSITEDAWDDYTINSSGFLV